MDGALAMHMLYHVPDVPAAVRELRRVLRPGGVLMVSTNGTDDKREVTELFVGALEDLTGTRIAFPDFDGGFTLDDADLLRAEFGSVQVAVFERETAGARGRAGGGVRRQHARPVRRPAAGRRRLGRRSSSAVRARVADEIARNGVWRLGNQVGVLTCR